MQNVRNKKKQKYIQIHDNANKFNFVIGYTNEQMNESRKHT